MVIGMPSIAHEAPIELIRQHPWLAAELVRRVTNIPFPSDDKARVALGATDASSVIPSEFRADIRRGAAGRAARAVAALGQDSPA
jgi:hypothetical protein